MTILVKKNIAAFPFSFPPIKHLIPCTLSTPSMMYIATLGKYTPLLFYSSYLLYIIIIKVILQQ